MATWPGPGRGSPMSATLVVLASIAGAVMITAFISQLLVRWSSLTATCARRQSPGRRTGPARRRQHGDGGSGRADTGGPAPVHPRPSFTPAAVSPVPAHALRLENRANRPYVHGP